MGVSGQFYATLVDIASISIGQEAEWALEPGWTLGEEKNLLCISEI